MKFRHKATVLTVVLVAGISLATGTAAAAEETKCSTPLLTSTTAYLADPGRWSYTFYVTWCVEKGVITDITPHVTHEADGRECVWVTSAEEAELPVPDSNGAWNAYNMAEFSCKAANGGQGSVNPWGVITIRPNGTSSVAQKGIGDVIVD